MGAYLNNQRIPMPFVNDVPHSAYVNNQIIWVKRIPKPISVPLGQLVFLKDDAAMIAAWLQYRNPEVWTEVPANEYFPHVANMTAAQAFTQWGANTVALNVNQIPSHTHNIQASNTTAGQGKGTGVPSGRASQGNGNRTYCGANDPAGSSQAHNNRPLSHAVRVFRKTA